MQIRRARALFLSVALAAALAAPAARAETETVVSHGLSAFGELKYPADFTHFGYARPDAPRGGRIALRPSTARNTFDHFNETLLKGDAAARSLELLFDTLMARAFDEPDASYGLLAESVETPADRSFAIFRLRAEARFADGAPVTAEDVAWSLETLRDKAGPRVALQLRSLASATALDARTVRVDFDDSAPRRDMPARVGAMPIFSKKDFEGLDFAEPRAEPPLGSGPYRVGAFSQGRSVVYERREDYWAKDLPVRRGHYNFDKIELQYYLDTDVALLAFKDGEFDMIEEFKSANWATKYDIPEIADGRIVREVLPDERPSGA
ncbi:MAG: ABC transporter substrate-binding protein, partial [Pseudomonadota bacterium]